MRDENHDQAAILAPPRVSVTVVLCVLVGLYLSGYGVYRLRNEPPNSYYYFHSRTWNGYSELFKDVWQSSASSGTKLIQTVYLPCMLAEAWFVREVLW